MSELTAGTQVFHQTKNQHGTWLGYDEADSSGATSWVHFDGDDDDEAYMVSTHLLKIES